MVISFVIVNNNEKDLTYTCLKLISKTMVEESFQVILMDNASQDGSREVFYQFGRDISWLNYQFSEKKLSRPRLYNSGAKTAKGQILVFMEPHIYLNNRGFDQFIRHELNQECGILIPEVLHGKNKLDMPSIFIIRKNDFEKCFGFDEEETDYWKNFYSKFVSLIKKKILVSNVYSASDINKPPSFTSRLINL